MEWLKRLLGWAPREPVRTVRVDDRADHEASPAPVNPEPAGAAPGLDPVAAVADDAPVVTDTPVSHDPPGNPVVDAAADDSEGDAAPPAVIDDAPITTAVDAAPEHAPADPAPDLAPALRPALAAFQRGEFKTALAVAAPHTCHRDAAVRVDARRLCAQALGELKRWDEAFDHWLAVFDDAPTAQSALQLATTSVMCDEAERGEAWLERFDQLNARELSPVLARASFLAALARCGEMSLALPHLQWMRDVYLQLHVTDPAFLRQRGVPPFDAFLASSLPILRGALSPLDVRSWYSALDGRLDEGGQQRLQQWVAGAAKAA